MGFTQVGLQFRDLSQRAEADFDTKIFHGLPAVDPLRGLKSIKQFAPRKIVRNSSNFSQASALVE